MGVATIFCKKSGDAIKHLRSPLTVAVYLLRREFVIPTLHLTPVAGAHTSAET